MIPILTSIGAIYIILGILKKDKIFFIYALLLMLIFTYYLNTQFIIYALIVILLSGNYNVLIRNKKYFNILFSISLLFFFGLISLLNSSSLKFSDSFVSIILKPHIRVFLLSIIFFLYIKNENELLKVVRFYLFFVLFEIALTGPAIYFNLDFPIIEDIISQSKGPSLDYFIVFRRLYSGSISNGVNITLYLLPIIFIPIIITNNNQKWIYYCVSIMAIVLSILTWSRTILLGILIYLAVYLYNKTTRFKNYIIIFLIGLLLFLIFGDYFLERLTTEDRFSNLGNVNKRFDLMISYLKHLSFSNFFYGTTEDQQYLYLNSFIISETSSENTFIEVFFRSGIFSGFLYIWIIMLTFIKSVKSVRFSKINNNKYSYDFSIFLFCTYTSIIFMMNTLSLSSMELIIWIFILFINMNYEFLQNTKVRL